VPFYRYALWHEHAMALPKTIGLRRRTSRTRTPSGGGDVPVLLLHYEDYQDHFNETASRLLEFLELDVVAPKPPTTTLEPFRPLPSYEDYYLPDQVEAIRDLIHHLASKELWEVLRRYF
jgi:hypothetical protein